MAEPLPARVPLTLYRGDTRVWTITVEANTGTDTAPAWEPYDLTGHVLLAQVRAGRDRTDPVTATITAEPLEDTGQVRLTLTAEEADELGDDGTKLWWDFQTTRTDDGFRRTWLAGPVTVRGDASDE